MPKVLSSMVWRKVDVDVLAGEGCLKPRTEKPVKGLVLFGCIRLL